MKITEIDYKITPSRNNIAISYATKSKPFNILTPRMNDIYEYADMNDYLDWFEDKLDNNGNHTTVYTSRTFDELTEDVDAMTEVLEQYIYQLLDAKRQNYLLTF